MSGHIRSSSSFKDYNNINDINNLEKFKNFIFNSTAVESSKSAGRTISYLSEMSKLRGTPIPLNLVIEQFKALAANPRDELERTSINTIRDKLIQKISKEEAEESGLFPSPSNKSLTRIEEELKMGVQEQPKTAVDEQLEKLQAKDQQLQARDQQLQAREEQLKAQQLKAEEEKLKAEMEQLKAREEQLKAREDKLNAQEKTVLMKKFKILEGSSIFEMTEDEVHKEENAIKELTELVLTNPVALEIFAEFCKKWKEGLPGNSNIRVINQVWASVIIDLETNIIKDKEYLKKVGKQKEINLIAVVKGGSSIVKELRKWVKDLDKKLNLLTDKKYSLNYEKFQLTEKANTGDPMNNEIKGKIDEIKGEMDFLQKTIDGIRSLAIIKPRDGIYAYKFLRKTLLKNVRFE